MSSGTAPDSICPRGWMMVEYEGHKSYTNLINNIYGRAQVGNNRDTALLYSPLSFLHSGLYNNDSGNKNEYREIRGTYWISVVSANVEAGRINFNSSGLASQSNGPRGFGYSLRYVSRSAASAGSSIGMSSGTAPDSICPRGWMMATTTYDNEDKSYYNLINSVYGRITGYTANADTALLYQPFSFLRSGFYNWESASRINRSSNGLYWESRTYSSTNAYLLGFYSAVLSPQDGSNRGHGFSVRCVSRD